MSWARSTWSLRFKLFSLDSQANTYLQLIIPSRPQVCKAPTAPPSLRLLLPEGNSHTASLGRNMGAQGRALLPLC